MQIDEYYESCQLTKNMQDALESIFSREMLPYNPFSYLETSFLSYSEYFLVTKCHQDTGKF